MSETGEMEKITTEFRNQGEKEKYKEERLAAYEDWLQTLENQVQEGKMELVDKNRKIARNLLARDLQVNRYREQAKRDFLTNLPNKRAFKEKYKTTIGRGVPFGMLLVDVDHFKKVNDEYGHLTGDKVLIQMGLIMTSNLRETREKENFDVIARIGGEEFGILLPGVKSNVDLDNVAKRIKSSFDDPLFVKVGGEGKKVPITISIGGGLYQGEEVEQFFDKVDQGALYQAKVQGRNRIVILPTK